MVFVEVCPYASSSFGLADHQLRHLSQTDRGFQTQQSVIELLLDARPRAILVNGTGAISHFEHVWGKRVQWPNELQYESVARRGRWLWHKAGHFATQVGPVPLFGFPFLGKPPTHNSHAEVMQLAEQIRGRLPMMTIGSTN
jgi:hypothetical protein